MSSAVVGPKRPPRRTIRCSRRRPRRWFRGIKCLTARPPLLSIIVRPQRVHRMGFFDRLFGRKSTAPAPPEAGEDDDIQPTGSQLIHGPPEFVRAAELQRTYWTHNADEQAR